MFAVFCDICVISVFKVEVYSEKSAAALSDCRFLYSDYSKNYLTNPRLIVRLLTQSKLKPKAAIGSICDGDCAAVELDSVFYNGKSETCTTLLA